MKTKYWGAIKKLSMANFKNIDNMDSIFNQCSVLNFQDINFHFFAKELCLEYAPVPKITTVCTILVFTFDRLTFSCLRPPKVGGHSILWKSRAMHAA